MYLRADFPEEILQEVDEFRNTVNSAPLHTSVDKYIVDIMELARYYFKGNLPECKSAVEKYHSAVCAFPCHKTIAVSVSSDRITAPIDNVPTDSADTTDTSKQRTIQPQVGPILMLLTDNNEYTFATITEPFQIGSYTTGSANRFIWSDYCNTNMSSAFAQLLSKLTDAQKVTFEYILKPSVILPTMKLLDVICGLTARTFEYDSTIEIQVGHNVWEVYAFNRRCIKYKIASLPKQVTDHCESMSDHIETGKPIDETTAVKVRVQGKLGCNVCYKSAQDVKLMYCAACRLVKYCSRDCQAKDWSAHKRVCTKGTGTQSAGTKSV